MLTEEQNRMVTQVSRGTPMGDLLRRYWMPIAGVSEFDTRHAKPIRLMGEDLVLYKDLSGTFGLIERRCTHRRADLAHGFVEKCGLRCNYHGWLFDQNGNCTERPFEDISTPGNKGAQHTGITAYPVKTLGGMIWAYMGPQPAPLLPDWEAFSWPNGFAQVVITELPCNWFQCQENSIDPVHFEWMHENWSLRLRSGETTHGPSHLRLNFEEFDYGFTYHRTRADSDENDEAWTVGRVFLWPNGFFLGEHFEWRVPIDDENTLSVTWKFTLVPKERQPYVQTSIPTWYGPLTDANGKWIDSHVMNQDFIAWVGQGRIADRTKEHLGQSDRGIVAIRRRFFDEFNVIAAGGEPKGTIRDPAKNVRVVLPMMDRHQVLGSHSIEHIKSNLRLTLMYTTYIFQAGQPESVRKAFAEAMGIDVVEFHGIVPSRNKQKNTSLVDEPVS
jgi:5,5'-dehydrodivanillate O-demethylase